MSRQGTTRERETGPRHISLLESRAEMLWGPWVKSGLIISNPNEQGFGELHWAFLRREQGQGLGKTRRLLITKVLGDVTWRANICLCNLRVGRQTGKWGVTTNRYRFSLEVDEKFLKLDSSNSFTTLNILKNFELYTFN